MIYLLLLTDRSKLIAECSFDFKGDRRHCDLIGNGDTRAFRAPKAINEKVMALISLKRSS